MSECKYKNEDHSILYAMVFIIFFWVVFIKGCSSDNNDRIIDRLDIIEKAISK